MASAFLLACSITCSAQAQTATTETPVARKNNFVKTNLAGIVARNYSVQYERILSKRFSVALSYRMMPSGNVPFRSSLLEIFADDQDAKNAFEQIQVEGSAITPELRFYVGKKGYGQGFYLAPFYRAARFEGSGVKVDFETLPGQTESIQLSGNAKGNTAGLLLGAQWALGKCIVLDWWILGPHYGTGKANMNGIPSKTLSSFEQQQLREELENMEFPLAEKEVTVTANSAAVKLNGPWGGVRAGLSLGIRF